MSVGEVCRIAYVIMLDELLRIAETTRLVTMMAGVFGADPQPVPMPEELRELFDARLLADDEQPPASGGDRHDRQLRQALGIEVNHVHAGRGVRQGPR